MGGDLGESTYGRRWVSEAVLVTVSSGPKIRFAPRPKQSLKGSVAGFKGLRPPAAGPQEARRLVSKVSWQICHKMDLPGFEPGTFGNASLRNRCHNH